MNSRRRAGLSVLAPGVTLLLLLGGLLGLAVRDNNLRAQETIRVRTAFCEELEKVKEVQRADIIRRLAVARAYLQANPSGAPGISAEVIRQGIRNSKETLRALAPVRCEDFARANNIPIEKTP